MFHWKFQSKHAYMGVWMSNKYFVFDLRYKFCLSRMRIALITNLKYTQESCNVFQALGCRTSLYEATFHQWVDEWWSCRTAGPNKRLPNTSLYQILSEQTPIWLHILKWNDMLILAGIRFFVICGNGTDSSRPHY